jgi:hypothetical protein
VLAQVASRQQCQVNAIACIAQNKERSSAETDKHGSMHEQQMMQQRRTQNNTMTTTRQDVDIYCIINISHTLPMTPFSLLSGKPT